MLYVVCRDISFRSVDWEDVFRSVNWKKMLKEAFVDYIRGTVPTYAFMD